MYVVYAKPSYLTIFITSDKIVLKTYFSGGNMETFLTITSAVMILLVMTFIVALAHDIRQMKRFNRIYHLVLLKVMRKKDIWMILFVSGLSCPLTGFIAYASSRTDDIWNIPHIPFAIMSGCFGVIFVLLLVLLWFMRRYMIGDRGDT